MGLAIKKENRYDIIITNKTDPYIINCPDKFCKHLKGRMISKTQDRYRKKFMIEFKCDKCNRVVSLSRNSYEPIRKKNSKIT